MNYIMISLEVCVREIRKLDTNINRIAYLQIIVELFRLRSIFVIMYNNYNVPILPNQWSVLIFLT